MSDESSPAPPVQAAARGVVIRLTRHANTQGKAWATFDLLTAGGALPCLCFPRTFERVGEEIREGEHVDVSGQVTRGDGTEMRVLLAVRS